MQLDPPVYSTFISLSWKATLWNISEKNPLDHPHFQKKNPSAHLKFFHINSPDYPLAHSNRLFAEIRLGFAQPRNKREYKFLAFA